MIYSISPTILLLKFWVLIEEYLISQEKKLFAIKFCYDFNLNPIILWIGTI